ncbi:hypothetical protein NP233_g98 [Leucocoprinus birnbaumii]|uniref:Uncharacterized protein n=1 Tax=Leucocoprinus birnbaumii TaxID=56174 RepID=A0AAD5W779_9AGAR|nr:hypothetical protein NP233_g98 [Leucocoprinus birnbaumii]
MLLRLTRSWHPAKGLARNLSPKDSGSQVEITWLTIKEAHCDDSLSSPAEETSWEGGVSHDCDKSDGRNEWLAGYGSEEEGTDKFSQDKEDWSSDEEGRLEMCLERSFEHGVNLLQKITESGSRLETKSPFDLMMKPRSDKDWATAEADIPTGHTGKSGRTKRRHKQQAWEKEASDKISRQGASAHILRQFLCPIRNSEASNQIPVSDVPDHHAEGLSISESAISEVFTDTDDDLSPPPRKRQKKDISWCENQRKEKEEHSLALEQALSDVEKLIASKQVEVDAGKEGPKWGGWMVRIWVKDWMQDWLLPLSCKGNHIRSFTLLEDPEICAKLRSHVRSNKWAMNPNKIANFAQERMIPAEADKFLKNVLQNEIPQGLAKCLELEIFPWIHQKEGFHYTEYKKSLYYDGHERPDVVEHRQNIFIPTIDRFWHRIVEYQPDNLEEEVVKEAGNFVERRLVLVSQDEMMAQANDGLKEGWFLNGEQPLKKKGVGQGIHQSDVICPTVGWIDKASETMEYGKNYEGYWNGEKFVKQLREKIIPEFEASHGPGYQALILVDNSQGHCAYAEDALIALRMNLKPGGKQA